MHRRGVFLFLSFLSGYFSLSQEIAWIRIASFASGSDPRVFANVLGFLLLGIALGSLVVVPILRRPSLTMEAVAGHSLMASGILSIASLEIISWSFVMSAWLGWVVTYSLILILACVMGLLFPLLTELGSRRGDLETVSADLSFVYFLNILGATSGPIITGFVLFDRFTLESIVLGLGLASLFVGAFLVPSVKKSISALVAATLMTVILYSDRGFFDRLQYKEDYIHFGNKLVSQSRSGIITVQADNPDIIYGDGMYDGRFSIDPRRNRNGIRRLYAIGFLHPHPAQILQIGVSGGAWTRALVDLDTLESMTAVEINPDYERVIRHYPVQAEIFAHPKVTLFFDDGRRWLNRHPRTRFDFILINTTFHWRSGATNILSREFFQKLKQHLKPGGVFYFNTTNSKPVVRTAASVFRYVRFYENLLAASDSPFALSLQEQRESLSHFHTRAGRLTFDPTNPTDARVIDSMLTRLGPEIGDEYRHRGDIPIITDDNMVTEFPRDLFDYRSAWWNAEENR